ncbi:MAG: ABC transporter substrate-binding protein [Gammaproteobacteria bacterium]|nr:ABC transporter substrate-binding protein [Gammaproteobacteria bacterium]
MGMGKILFALLLLLPTVSVADASMAPDEVVRVTSDKVQQTLLTNREMLKKNPDAIIALVEDMVVPKFDFVRASAWVLGKHWRLATPEQRGRFVKEFQDLLLNTYASALLEYADFKITFLPLRMKEGDRTVMVRTKVLQPGADTINLDYRLFNGKEGWKVLDILVDNVSLIANYRSSFGEEVEQNGLDALLARLAKSNSEKRAKK